MPDGHELNTAQPITFETMRIASEFAKDKTEVKLFSTQYPEDHDIIPSYIQKLPDLKRSVSDVHHFKKSRKLPLIQDILNLLSQDNSADYVIYTNADIALMPQFYLSVHMHLDQGHDALIINRRRIHSRYDSVDQIPAIFSDLGRSHPGFDCFVFKPNLINQFVLEQICIGVQFIGVALAHNLFTLAQNPKLIADEHLTIHIGQEVMTKRNVEYYNYNRKEYKKVYRQLRPKMRIENFPYYALPWHKRIIKWGLNPSISIRCCLELEAESFSRKIKLLWDELRFKILQNP